MRRTLPTLAVVIAGLLACAAPASAAPPPNDDFEHAAPVGGPVTGTLDEATAQPGEPSHGVQTVWYAFRPSTSGRVAAELPRQQYDLDVAVYTGTALSGLHSLGRSQSQLARVAFDAQAGETYWIVVTSRFNSTGTEYTLRVRPAPVPANDSFADARRVKVPGRYSGNLADASAELAEPEHDPGNRASHSVWSRFTARRTGRLSIQATSPDCNTPVAVYTGTRIDALRRVGRSRGTVRFRAKRGRTYRVAVDCGGETFGDYELTISDGSIAGKGVALAVTPGQTVESVRRSISSAA